MQERESRPGRRGRTAALIAGAAVVGLVAGTCAGYLVQADRDPTKLPPLSQPTLTQAKGPAPEPLSAEQDPKLRTDGDLRKLLLKKPAGAKEADWVASADGWLDIAGYAEYFENPGEKLNYLVEDEFRRAAVAGWDVPGAYSVEIRLLQYRHEDSLAALDATRNYQEWAEAEPAAQGWSIPGTGDGMAYVHNRRDWFLGHESVYSAEAYAWRGDIAVEIAVWSDRPVTKKTIMDLAERQMERL